MKVVHISNSDSIGGAAIAAYRIHCALLDSQIESFMFVNTSLQNDSTVYSPSGTIRKVCIKIRQYISLIIHKLLKGEDNTLHSLSILPSRYWIKKINDSNCDIVHLHWFNHEMLSISDITKIKKPIVWTMHDLWGCCGAEHISWNRRWQEGYNKSNGESQIWRFDLNRWTWNRKLKYWKDPITIVSPSTAHMLKIKNSFLMNSWPIFVVPNCLDINKWKPIKKNIARDLLDYNENDSLIAFGSFGSNMQLHKGYDLLIEALKYFSQYNANVRLIVFGKKPIDEKISDKLPFPVDYIGHLHDQLTLRALYSSIDVLLVPSRQESFGQTASEAQACGTPVVAFDTGGLKDVVEHKETGYLAKPFSVHDFAKGIQWTLNECRGQDEEGNIDKKKLPTINQRTRMRATKLFSYKSTANQYINIYNGIVRAQRTRLTE